MKLIAAVLLSLLCVPATAQAAPVGCGVDCEVSVNDGPVCVVPNTCKVVFRLNAVAQRNVVVDYRLDDRTASRGVDYDADPTGRVVIEGGSDRATLSIRTLPRSARDREIVVVATSVAPGRIAKASGVVTLRSAR